MTGCVLDVLGAVVGVVVLVPPAPIGELVLGLAAVPPVAAPPVIEPDPAGAAAEPGGVVEPIAGPAPPPIRATVCSSSVPV